MSCNRPTWDRQVVLSDQRISPQVHLSLRIFWISIKSKGKGDQVTAEIAILNKSAVAIAADSAVTISAGDSQEKIFDSADKLFELCDKNPIGIMLYNGMEFMGTPLAILVKDFRSKGDRFPRVEQAGEEFPQYLQKEGLSSPASVHDQNLRSIIHPQLAYFSRRVTNELLEKIQSNTQPDDVGQFFKNALTKTLTAATKSISRRRSAKFIGQVPSKVRLDRRSKKVVREVAQNLFPACDEEILDLVEKFVTVAIRKDIMSPGKTGIVVCGFGEAERFPSLVWYETDGMLCGHLKYRISDAVDIDREGRVAAVMPFAQKDMIERFLYGLDEAIEVGIKQFCRRSVPEISKSMLERLDFENDESAKMLREEAADAERAFLRELDQSAFQKVRETSRSEIEDMVEFMPKPEMAKMAEALIDLTSIKRRVTRGMETVGGPVDVAVISRAEGFVWVKRKHYFPAELNGRFTQRMQNKISHAIGSEENGDGND